MIEITLGDKRFQIRREDPLNLKVYEYKTVNKGKDKEREDWVHDGCYFSSIEYAALHIYKKECKNSIAGSEEAMTLDKAIEEMKKMEKHLLSQIKKGLENEGK